MPSDKNWRALATEKRASILAAIPDEWHITPVSTNELPRDVTGPYIQQFLTEREKEITEMDAGAIVKKTVSGQWSAVEVAKAFCHRAAVAHQLVSCLHEVFFDAALKDAAELDAYMAKNKKPIGILHGLPVSLKDQFHIRGVETTMGYVGWIGTFQGQKDSPKRHTYESEIVWELRQLGAVLYVKTSVPHTLMCGETVNNIIGYTLNPRNRLLSAGGSSGGEGALIALRGSPVGFGTDIGGSIRIPAGFNGLFSIRPCTGRLPYEGIANSLDGQNSVLSVVGPIATSVRSLRLVIQGLLETSPWLRDPMVHEMPWRPDQAWLPKKLTFGVIWDDDYVGVSPPVKRALHDTVEALKKAGHELCFKTWVYDGGLDLHNAFALSGEPLSPQIASSFGTAPTTQFTGSDIMAVNVAKREAAKEYMAYWNTTQGASGRVVDAILCPLAPFPAARPEMYFYYGYTTRVNLLDYTSVSVPVTTVKKEVDVVDPAFEPRNEVDKRCHESYGPEIYDGAHVSLQCVDRRLQEEKMLAIADVITAALR